MALNRARYAHLLPAVDARTKPASRAGGRRRVEHDLEDRSFWERNDQAREEDGGDRLQGVFHKREASVGGAFHKEQINWRWDLRVRIVAAGNTSDG